MENQPLYALPDPNAQPLEEHKETKKRRRKGMNADKKRRLQLQEVKAENELCTAN